MNRRTRNIQLPTCLLITTLSSTLHLLAGPLAFAGTKDTEASPVARIERLKEEIESFKVETDTTIALMNEAQEKNRCLEDVYTGLEAFTQKLDSIGPRNRVSSLANRTRDLVRKHSSFFVMLSDFSKQTQLLIENSDLTGENGSDEIRRTTETATQGIAKIGETFQQQANDEHLLLVEITATVRHLQRAGAAATAGLESTKKCATHLVEKQKDLLDVGKKVLNDLEKARALIAQLQLKRSRILGSIASALQLTLTSRVAKKSGKNADDIVARLNASLADLSLSNEVERWWFEESIERGPARGHLWGEKEDATKAIEYLRLAIAQCDALIARSNEIDAMSTSAENQEKNTVRSNLEVTLYQRRSALSRWLKDAYQATTK